ncbi:MAG: GGDEF domain-containing protein, partial [Parafilimonas terrae]|nr:GGDEF domain-containing protein [Parafilimonas terrae]
MPNESSTAWGRGELYETLCLLVIGAGIWFVGVTLGTFDSLNAAMSAYGLNDLLMLAACMGVALFGASVRKSILLRRLMLQRDAAAAQAEAIARHDGLTGLANRRRFIDAVERAQATLGAEPSSAVLLIDLDRFKPVNDLYGHAAGNAVLCAVAERLQQ